MQERGGEVTAKATASRRITFIGKIFTGQERNSIEICKILLESYFMLLSASKLHTKKTGVFADGENL